MIIPSARRKRILIVDDEPAIREFCQRVLTEEGFEVATASNGTIALAMISKQEYELYLLDIRMPEMNGKEMYESLQKTYPRSSGRPILLKPFTTNELKAIITKTLKAVDK